MDLLRSLVLAPLIEDARPSLVLFLLSAGLLVVCLVLKARSRAVRLSHLERIPLNVIERTHPHLPSPRVIVALALSCLTLLLSGLHVLRHIAPFDDPSHGLGVASVFLLLATVGILAELRWKGAGRHASAVVVGTSLAFLVRLLLLGGTAGGSAHALSLLLLVPAFTLAGRVFWEDVRGGGVLSLLIAFALWMLLFLVQ